MRLPNFSGKVLLIELSNSADTYDLYDPRFETQGNRLFIIGKVPYRPNESNWVTDKELALAWEQVDQYYVFDSLEDFHQRLQISAAFEEENDDN